MIRKDPDIIEMRKKFDKRLDQKFKEAYDLYIAGNWA